MEVWEIWFNTEDEVVGWVNSAVSVWGINEEDVAKRHARIGEAFLWPVLNEEELPV